MTPQTGSLKFRGNQLPPSTLGMITAQSSDTYVPNYQTTRHHIPEGCI